MTLMLHCGAEEVPYEMLREMKTPEATATHVPVPHFRVVDLVRHSLGFFGHSVVKETHATTKEGNRYFGLMELKSDYGNYTDTLIVRNSHDKTFPTQVGVGSQCFCCDNLAFIATRSVSRRHTKKLAHDLPGLVMTMIEPLAEQREAQHRKMLTYQGTMLTDEIADHAILQAYRNNVINIQRVAEVVKQWEEPEHQEWMPGTAYHLFNCVTWALNGRVAESPDATERLHQVIDATCEEIAA